MVYLFISPYYYDTCLSWVQVRKNLYWKLSRGWNPGTSYPQSVKSCSSEIEALLMSAQREYCIVTNLSQWFLILMVASSRMCLWRREFSLTLNVVFNCWHLVLHPFWANWWYVSEDNRYNFIKPLPTDFSVSSGSPLRSLGDQF